MRRLTGFALLFAIGLLAGKPALGIVTSDGFGTHINQIGDAQGDSVAFIEFIDSANNFAYVGSGTLIGDGHHILTSAHNLIGTNSLPRSIDGVVAYFVTPQGVTTASPLTANIHPAYLKNSSLGLGYDLALLNFSTALPTDIPRQDILRSTLGVEIGQPMIRYGYGGTGVGSVGYDPSNPASFDVARRVGLNVWDNFSGDGNRLLSYDFDSGSAANNVTGDLGTGIHEVSGAFGDSGGPVFVVEGSEMLIAGVTTAIEQGPSGVDANPSLWSSWGDLGHDTRVSDPLNQGFIDLWVNQGALIGDINLSGSITAADIDSLFAAVNSSAAATPTLDLNMDSVVAQTDVDQLVREIMQTRYGDADLSGIVNSDDFNVLAANYGKSGTWATGDFDGNGIVNSDDFNLLAANYGWSRTASSIPNSMPLGLATNTRVPEPISLVLSLGLLSIALMGRWCRA